jgi:GWxTD domain-containing protein
MRPSAPVVLVVLFLASTASAAVSSQYNEWRNGPVQWIMTGPEKAAWKKVSSDQEAVAFIDLFWARRDPSPGTPENEARAEHDARVKYADETFAERGKRGSLTDRGRVWTVLGVPPNYTDVQGRVTSTVDSHVRGASGITGGVAGGGGGGMTQAEPSSGRLDPSGGRQQGARSVWIWEHDKASALFDMPRVEVVFVTDPLNGKTIRDVFRRDFAAAESAVLKKQIRNDYKELPAWAAFGGLVPQMRTVTFSGPAPAPVAAAPASAAPTPAAAPLPAATAPRGATRLTLTRNVFEVDAQGSGDPFASLQSADRFKTSEELGWVAQYCGQSDRELSVPFMVRLTGGPAESPIDAATPMDEVVPDRLKAVPGCYMLRGAIPLESMAAGKYMLHVMIDDPIVKNDSYELKQAFTIE